MRIWDCNIGVHEGGDHTGESIGLIRFTPWEAVVVAAHVAMKSADVQIGFMDRFLRLPHPDRRLVSGTDCSGRGCTLFRPELGFKVSAQCIKAENKDAVYGRIFLQAVPD